MVETLEIRVNIDTCPDHCLSGEETNVRFDVHLTYMNGRFNIHSV